MSKQVGNIHDAFFKRVLSDPELAGAFLREHLPSDVASLLGPEAPEPISGSFVDEEFRAHHSDLLFRMHLKADGDAFAYILLEHKSSPDFGARLQLLRYVVRLLTDWYAQNKQRLPLPPVLPVLAHQGPGGWALSCEFTEMFGTVPEPLRPYLPSFRHVLVDLGPMDDRSLSETARLRAFLKALKYGRRSDLVACLDILFAEATELADQDLLVILTYLEKLLMTVDNKVLHETLLQIVPDRMERIMGCLTQPYYDKGLAKGKAEAKAECEAKILTRFLEKRFGAVPMTLRQRILAADTAAIEAWLERVLDAQDLQSVFASN